MCSSDLFPSHDSRADYQELTNDTGIDFIANPDIITQESNALISALWFETKKGDVGWRNVTYHSTIANALETIAERETKRKLSSINIDLTELAKELETLRKEFLLEVDKRG